MAVMHGVTRVRRATTGLTLPKMESLQILQTGVPVKKDDLFAQSTVLPRNAAVGTAYDGSFIGGEHIGRIRFRGFIVVKRLLFFLSDSI